VEERFSKLATVEVRRKLDLASNLASTSNNGIEDEPLTAASGVGYLPYYYGFELSGNINTEFRDLLCEK
jgi:hypothetical protein